MSGDLYSELIASQVGKNGQFGYLIKKQKQPKPTPIPKIDLSFSIFDGTISEAHDDNGLCDTYVVIKYVKPDGTQKAFYRIKQLVLELWDQDLLKKNDYIGSATLNFDEIINDKPLNGKVDFFDNSQKLAGTVRFYFGQKIK
ncbi:hypothetical protein ACTFIR_002616 [Dictyostelium discoideum]